jgi:MFS transporter, DHA2 family, multidrug resistance protein
VFRHRGFAVSAMAMLLTFGSFMGSIVLIPLWLQTNMGYTATSSGELMAFNGVLGVVMAPVAALMLSRVDPRAIMSTGLLIVAADTLYRTTFNSDMTFGQLIPAQLALGLGMPLFFVPMMSLAMGSVSPQETASASGLVNFLRTMSGAFATAIITFAWHDNAIGSRVDLAGKINDPQGILQKFRDMGQSAQQALQSLDNLVQSQSVMLATNRIFLFVGAILVATAAGVWLMPKPKGPVALPTGGH